MYSNINKTVYHILFFHRRRLASLFSIKFSVTSMQLSFWHTYPWRHTGVKMIVKCPHRPHQLIAISDLKLGPKSVIGHLDYNKLMIHSKE